MTYFAREPFEITNLTASGTNELSVILNWTDPIDDGGDSIDSYLIEYADITDGFTEWESKSFDFVEDKEYNLSGLISDHTYVFKMAAVNAVGIGDFSTETPPTTVSKPVILSAFTFNDANYTRIRLRRDTAANWSGVNPTLALGEAGYETDTRLLKIGDNVSTWTNLDYVKVENSSIDFPDPPDVLLTIGDSPVNADSPRVRCNISDNEKLNLVGEQGITLTYDNDFKAVRFGLNQVFTPFNSGSLFSPTSRGRPGSVYYDDKFLYICTLPNYWKRVPLVEQPWFAADQIDISSEEGYYPSITNFYFSGSNLLASSDGDPFPAKASTNLTNDGLTPRSDFYKSYQISEQDYNFSMRFRGGTNTSAPQSAQTGINGIMTNGSIFGHPNALNESIGIYSAPENFHYNRVFFTSYFKVDNCGGFVDFGRRYIYYHAGFLSNCWNDSKVYESNPYYNGSNYNGDYFRYSNGHSKIIGFAFDGYPVYGPFGYEDSEDNQSDIVLMTSSYVTKQDDDHRPVGWKYTNAITVDSINYNLTAGAFIEDYEYGEGSGILDQYNGRYSVTPEYPNGTYAYYVTFTDETLLIPKYPYIIGNYTKQTRVDQNISQSLNPLTVDGYFPVFTDTQSAVNYGLLNGGNGTYTTYTIFSSSYYMPNGVLQRFPSTPTDIVLSENKVSEKATIGSIIGTFSTVDENINDSFTYSLVDTETYADNNNFVIVNNELRTNITLSHSVKATHNIKVRSTDQTNRFVDKTMQINVLAGTTLTSLSITSTISSLVANDSHTFTNTTQGTATDLQYAWYIYGSDYVASNDTSSSTMTINSVNEHGLNDQTITVYLTVKSISAFNSLTATTSFVLDHSEDPVCIAGYYPLYASIYDAERDPNGDGSAHMHTVQGVLYWMPNGLPDHWHGSYDCSSLE